MKEVKIAEAKANNKKYTVQLIITIAVIALMVVAIIMSLVAYSSRIARSLSKVFGNKPDNAAVEEIIAQNFTTPTMPEIPSYTVTTKTAVAKRTEPIDKAEPYKNKGRWSSGVYEIGKDIPEGTYLVITDGRASELFPIGLYPDAQARDEDNFIGETWAEFSRYITLTEPGFVKVSWANIFDIEENDIENNPYEHPGMFLVGRDIEPGTYELEPVIADNPHAATYTIYSDVDAVVSVVKNRGTYVDDMFVTLKEGEFIKLEKCILAE